MLKPGEYAYDKLNNERVQVLAVSEVWGFVSYKVFRPSDGGVYKLPADALAAESAEFNRDEDYIRYVALLSRIKNETSGGVLTKLSQGIIPLPHQRYVLERVLRDNAIRYILADEVGLGKTIEAGLIIKELKARGLIKRILVVCPTGLVTQWKMEMREKFGEEFNIILPDEYATFRRITDSDDIYSQFDQVISPMDSIKPLERRIGWSQERIEKYNDERIHAVVNSGWDLIVIDEAHRVAGSSGEVARHKLGTMLSAASPYLLLLTATPHNGKTEPFLRLVRLLDQQAFPSQEAIVREQVAPYIIRTEKREAIDINGNRLFRDRTTKAINLTWGQRHSLQRKLYTMVTDYVSGHYNKALRNRGKNMWFIFLLIMMQRLVSSSTRAIRESMERRIDILEQEGMQVRSMSEEEFASIDIEMEMEDAIAAISLDIKEEIAALTDIIAVAQQAEYQYPDVKVEPLLQILDESFAGSGGQKVIIFTEFVATQSYLAESLMGRGYKVSLLNGSMSIDERNDVLVMFRQVSDILISTDAGGEGLNLQFSNCVINYDLPWNPMKIEQRIGRVDRIGQQRDVVAYNFILTDTIEARVREVLEEKLSTILQELGVDKYADVLDGEQAEVNFTDAYMRSIRDKRYTPYATKAVEDDFIRQVDNNVKIKGLIKDKKDLQALVGLDGDFDLDASLHSMLTYYERSNGNTIADIGNYGITDPIILRHLNRDIEFAADGQVPRVGIRDFPNEAGCFMLWELSVSNDQQSRRIIPIFINEEFTLRPMAGKKIWDAILDESSVMTVSSGHSLSSNNYDRLAEASREYAYDTFISLKDETIRRRAETYRKYMYALNIRMEAAQRIGIDNIRKHKLARLASEKTKAEGEYLMGNDIFPEFRPLLVLRMEGGNA